MYFTLHLQVSRSQHPFFSAFFCHFLVDMAGGKQLCDYDIPPDFFKSVKFYVEGEIPRDVSFFMPSLFIYKKGENDFFKLFSKACV